MALRFETPTPALHRKKNRYYFRIRLWNSAAKELKYVEVSLRTPDYGIARERYQHVLAAKRVNKRLTLDNVRESLISLN